MASALTIQQLTMWDGPDWLVRLLGQEFKPSQQANLFKAKKKVLSSTPGPTGAYGIDAMYLKVTDIAASGTLTIDLTSFTDIAAQSAASMARLKAFYFLLVDGTIDSTITYTPTGVAVGAAGSNPHGLTLTDAASDKVTLLGGEAWGWFTPIATGKTVDSTHKNVLITNNDSTNVARVAVILAGGKS